MREVSYERCSSTWRQVSQATTNAEGCRKDPLKTAGHNERITRGEPLGTITKNKGIMKKIQKWMKKENKVFSIIGGERFTNGDVVYTHAGLLLFLVAIGVVGALVQ